MIDNILGNNYGGSQIVESPHVTIAAEDWSRVRSPSRARRRLKRGFKQNVLHYRKPSAMTLNGIIYAHQDFVKELNLQLAKRGERYPVGYGPRVPPPVILESLPRPEDNWITARLAFKTNPMFNTDFVS